MTLGAVMARMASARGEGCLGIDPASVGSERDNWFSPALPPGRGLSQNVRIAGLGDSLAIGNRVFATSTRDSHIFRTRVAGLRD